MGILSDLFVATPEQASRYAHRIEEPDEGEEIKAILSPREYKGLTSVELGTLWAILERAAYDPHVHMADATFVDGDDESWLNRLPERFTALLADATAAQISEACVAWAKTAELRCDPANVAPVINDLQSLARQARPPELSVYLWGCL